MDRYIYAPFPNFEDRYKLFKNKIQVSQTVLQEKDLEYLANATEK